MVIIGQMTSVEWITSGRASYVVLFVRTQHKYKSRKGYISADTILLRAVNFGTIYVRLLLQLKLDIDMTRCMIFLW